MLPIIRTFSVWAFFALAYHMDRPLQGLYRFLGMPCQLSDVNAPLLFGNDAPVIFGNDAPPEGWNAVSNFPEF
jgi:hypothetical protein